MIKVLFENSDLAVIDKPAGLVVYNPPGKQDNTLVDEIIKIWPSIRTEKWHESFRAGIVHRLDKDTSGLIIIAKNPQTQLLLQQQMKSHNIHKYYTLLCLGKTPTDGEIKTQTTRDAKQYNKQKISLMSFSWQKNKVKEAITKYKTIQYYNYQNQTLSLVKAQILTGRTHQIRNHFHYIGYPLIGDQMYFTKTSKNISYELKIFRQFLHSTTLEFNLPDGTIKKISSNLPKDLDDILISLKRST